MYALLSNCITALKATLQRKLSTRLVVTVFIGLFFRVLFIDRHAYWYDEFVSNTIADNTLMSLIRASALDNYPPLYFLMLRMMYVFSHEYLILRISSVVLGTVTLLVAYFVFRHIANTKTALLATIFMAISPLHIYFSTELRMYVLLVFELLLAMLIFLRYVKQQTISSMNMLLLLLVEIAALYTHYYAGLFFIALSVVIFVYYRLRIVSWILMQLIALAAFALWVWYAIDFSRPPCWCMDAITSMLATFSSFSINGVGTVTFYDIFLRGPLFIRLFLFVISVYFFLLFVLGLVQLPSRLYRAIRIVFFVPLGAMSVISIWFRYFSPRSMIIISPFFYLFVALSITSRKNNVVQFILRYSAYMLLIAVLGIQFFSPFFTRT